MKSFLSLAAAAFALAAPALTAAPASAQTAQERSEERLAKMLEGREAGEPQACIRALNSRDIEVIDYVGIVYESGDTIWVSRVKDPRSLRWSDIPVFDRYGSQLCKFDVVRTVDSSTHMYSGAVFLEDFVPYRKPDAE